MYRVSSLLPKETSEYIEDTLECTPRELQLTALSGKKAESALFLRASSERYLQVFFYSTHYRMQPQAGFARGEEIHVSYRFDASGLSAGQTIRGHLIMLTDIGQLQIPFTVQITDSYEDEKLGSIRNLFHFTNLASTDWKAAKELFYSDRMEKLLKGHDSALIPLYRGLSASRDNGRNMDEFLINLNKKKKALYTLEEDTLLFPQVYDAQQQIIRIKRKGWGYSHLTVSAQGKYITLEKTVITEEDFVDNVCNLTFYLLPTDGFEHREKLIIETDSPSGTLTCELVRIGKVRKENPKEKEKKEKRRQTALLMRAYLDHETGRRDPAEALQRAEKCIDNINKTDGHNIAGRLFQTRLLCAMGRFQEAGWIFSHVERMVEKEEISDELMAYYWYMETILSAGINGGECDKRLSGSVVRRLRDLLANQRRNPVITTVYLKLLPESQITPIKKLSLYEECCYGGCNSPLLYLEAFRVMEENPAYITNLGRFEVAVLFFALRYNLLTEGVEQRIVELVGRQNAVRKDLLSFLHRMYQGYQEDDLLQKVCGLLIRCGYSGPGSMYWFGKAVDKQLRITMLYESYMMARGMEDLSLPPKYVLMYFAYQCNLDKACRAHLYRVVLEHHTRLGALIDLYDPQIREFAKDCLIKGDCSRDLAYCYRFLLSDETQIPEVLPYLEKIAFLYRIKVDDPFAKYVIVIEQGLEREQKYKIESGSVLAQIYTRDHTILLADESGNRELAKNRVVIERLLSDDLVKKILPSLEGDESGLSLVRLALSPEDFMKNTEDWPSYVEVSRDPEISLSLRLDILDRLLRVLYERDESETLEKLLDEYPIEGADEKKRGQIIAYHIGLEQDETALSLLWEYGFEGVPPKSLNRLIRRGLENAADADPKWLALGYYTYRQGKYTQELLQYLCNFYEGGIQQMQQIFQDAAGFDVDATLLAGRVLIASAFSHAYLPSWDTLYDAYAKAGTRDMLRRLLQDLCFRCFVGGEVISEGSQKILERTLLEDEELPLLCKQTFLYQMSQREELSDRERELTVKMLKEHLRIRGYLPFFEKFTSLCCELLPYASKTYLVYRSKPGRKVTVSFMGGGRQQDTYQVKPLKELCPGYYVRDFVLFYSESLQYYIQEEIGGERVLTESGRIEKEQLATQGTGRFEKLNSMMVAHLMGDEKEAAALAEEYMLEEKLVEELFL